jgi:hypothetical protein
MVRIQLRSTWGRCRIRTYGAQCDVRKCCRVRWTTANALPEYMGIAPSAMRRWAPLTASSWLVGMPEWGDVSVTSKRGRCAVAIRARLLRSLSVMEAEVRLRAGYDLRGTWASRRR